jgi:hypothetical protein
MTPCMAPCMGEEHPRLNKRPSGEEQINLQLYKSPNLLIKNSFREESYFLLSFFNTGKSEWHKSCN